MATSRRWPILNLDVSPGVVKIPVLGMELQRLAMQLSRPSLIPYARFDIDGVEHIPAAGPAILVANHRSYFDSAAMSMAIAQSGRTVRFLGKKEVFDAPLVGQLATAMGGIRVDRGHRVGRAVAGRRRRARRRRGRGDHAAGHDPAGPGVLRSRAQGPLGRRPAGPDDEGAGHPDRPVGHRAGVAPVEPAAQRAQRRTTRRRCGSASASPSTSSTARSTPTRSGS